MNRTYNSCLQGDLHSLRLMRDAAVNLERALCFTDTKATFKRILYEINQQIESLSVDEVASRNGASR